jgi:DNA mismatch repair protein MutS
MASSVSDDYFGYYTKYRQEYGERTCVFMQIGSFYEMQAVKNEKECIGNLEEVARVLNIQVTRKNKSIPTVDRSNPNFAGFPKHAISKFLPLLLDTGYTVVIVDQDDTVSGGRKTRQVSGVYSPGIQPLGIVDDKSTSDGNNLTNVTIEVNEGAAICYSIANVNLSTNVFEVYENGVTVDTKHQTYESVLDDIYRIMLRYTNNEVVFNIIQHSTGPLCSQFQKEFLMDYLDIYTNNNGIQWIHFKGGNEMYAVYKLVRDLSYQNENLKKLYKHIDFGLLEPVEYFGLEMCQLATINVLLTLQFIAKHDIKYINSIAAPKLVKESEYLVLEMNTLQQLAVLPKNNQSASQRLGSLFDVIDKTKTPIGKRGLKKLLSKPFKSVGKITERFLLSEQLDQATCAEKQAQLDGILSEIKDFERFHRKVTLGILNPYEFVNLHKSYQKLVELQDFLLSFEMSALEQACLSSEKHEMLKSFMTQYSQLFDLEEMGKYNLQETAFTIGNFFNKGSDIDIDKISDTINELEKQMEDLRCTYLGFMGGNSSGDWLKTSCTDQDGYFFTCTKIRTQLLQKGMSDDEYAKLTIKNTSSMYKISSAQLKSISLQLINWREVLVKRVRMRYLACLQDFNKVYGCLFEDLKDFVSVIDITNSNVKCKRRYNYCKPIIASQEDGEQSFLKAEGMRHPIIERVQHNVAYVPNDIVLDNTTQGMVLYALNSCGKSSLLRSIGLCVIMAQCGLYVPCTQFEFAPFASMISQVDLYDNLWKAQSSFITEMVGLRKILKVADSKCLVLSDELTKGTEVVSATSIFATAVLELLSRKCKFVFTTHLQDVAKLEAVKSNEHLNVCHLSVTVQGDDIIFDRKLQPGPCSELYGLEVARAVGLDKTFIDTAFEIRNSMLAKKAILDSKKSRYNASKRLQHCEVCGYCPGKKTDIPLDTHHIHFQCTADDNDFISHYHKNAKHNLVCLCKICHTAVHNGKIDIQGYVQTTSGVKLQFQTSV